MAVRCKPDCDECCCKPCALCIEREREGYSEDEITEVIPDMEAHVRELDAAYASAEE